MKSNFQKLKERIFQPEWHKTRPAGLISNSDAYYVQLSNKILSIFNRYDEGEIANNTLKRFICIGIAAYFEDVISNIGLWRAFITIHSKMYGKYLPFYDIDTKEYVEDEINIEDIQFLIWAFLQRHDIDIDKPRIINPENPVLNLLAVEIYDLLDGEYTTAPENEALYTFVHKIDYAVDIIAARELLGWVHYDCYLAMSYTRNSLLVELDDLKNAKKDEFYKENSEILKYALEKIGIFSKTCGPLAIKAKDWVVQVFEGTSNANLFEAMDFRQISNYNVLNSDTNTFTLIDTDKNEYIVVDESLSSPTAIKQYKSIMCSLLYFNGYWHVNGFASFSEQKSDLEQLPSKAKALATNKQTHDFILKELKSEISYYKNSNDLIAVMSKLFPLTDKNKLIPADFHNQKNFILFTHPEIGLSIFPELALQICDSKNPYYDKDYAEEQGLGILTGNYKLPKPYIEYLMDKQLLKDISIKSLHGKAYGNKQVQDNIRFLVRFFQPELYN